MKTLCVGNLPCRLVAYALLFALGGCVSAAMEGANIAKDKAVYEKHIDAARAGDAKAEYTVGDSLCCSLGQAKGFYDTRQAVDWLCRSAAQGYAPASRKLGEIYSGDVVHGVRLLRRAAEGVSDRPEDHVVSYAWFWTASQQGSKESSADAAKQWDKLSNADRTEVHSLLSSGKPLPCRWDEVFPKVGR